MDLQKYRIVRVPTAYNRKHINIIWMYRRRYTILFATALNLMWIGTQADFLFVSLTFLRYFIISKIQVCNQKAKTMIYYFKLYYKTWNYIVYQRFKAKNKLSYLCPSIKCCPSVLSRVSELLSLEEKAHPFTKHRI